ncbi:MAG: formyltransferase family protein, partial [Verrucomicrobia bacterium]|nr:formyltransferase family protein [Verrucomicrobiota bacterium]
MIRVVFIGTGEIGVPSLRWLLSSPHLQVVASVTQPDKPAGRNLALRSSPIKDLSLLHHLPVLQPLKLRSPDSIASLSDLHPDLIVVMAYGQILPQEI